MPVLVFDLTPLLQKKSASLMMVVFVECSRYPSGIKIWRKWPARYSPIKIIVALYSFGRYLFRTMVNNLDALINMPQFVNLRFRTIDETMDNHARTQRCTYTKTLSHHIIVCLLGVKGAPTTGSICAHRIISKTIWVHIIPSTKTT